MKSTTLRDLRDNHPFKPFSIHLSDGRLIPVVTADHIFISPNNDEFVVYSSEGHLQVLDAAHVTGITRKSKRNGKSS